ncbi:hypothetical protein DFH09DRAFT_1319059 [Mycena vulgaris]|nr:hypothetical protein DFH09DRAFT_1319059 [Mycena vulgaris]
MYALGPVAGPGRLGEGGRAGTPGLRGSARSEMRIRMLRVLLPIALAGELLVVLRLTSCCRFLRLGLLYLEAHNMIHGITGNGAGNGPFMSIHDGFQGVTSWAGFIPELVRLILDTHPRTPFAVAVAGEFSNGYNDCGLCLTGVNGSQHYGGDCALWEDSSTSNASVTAGVREFALASMVVVQDWFFWTWKIGPAVAGVVRSPLCSYQLGLEGGWMPTDPRTAVGKCAAIGVLGEQFPRIYSAWQTGDAGAGTIAAAATAQSGQWPPATTRMERVDAGIWDTERDEGRGAAPVMTAVAGCTYPNPWDAVSSPAPTALCTGA